jgi:hypothetical protein
MNSYRFHEQSVLWTLRLCSGPELAEGFDCGLFKPPLRANLEPGAKHPVETCNESFSLFAGAYSRIQRIRELCRLDFGSGYVKFQETVAEKERSCLQNPTASEWLHPELRKEVPRLKKSDHPD